MKLPKKYELKRIGGKLLSKSDAKLKFSDRDIDYDKLVMPIKDLDCKVQMKSPKALQDFIEPLVCDQQLYNSLKQSQFSNSLMLISPQDKPTIDRGIEILMKIKAKLIESQTYRNKHNFEDYCLCMEKVAELNSEYLEVIPKNNPELIAAFLNDYQVNTELEQLKAVYSLSFQVRAALAAYWNIKKFNPYDYILGSLSVNLEVVDPSSSEQDLVLHYLNSQSVSNHTLTNIIKVKGLAYTEKEDKKFLATDNHLMLWHGTPAQNILSILRQGLRIKPSQEMQHGRRYGHGIYFSDSFNLSNCFAAESNTQKYILLCEVATGNCAQVIQMSANGLPKGANHGTVRAMSGTGHDWDNEVLLGGVAHPTGRQISYDQPFISGKAEARYNSYTEFQKHVQGKIKQELKFVGGKQNKDEDEDEEMESEKSSSEEDEDEEMVEAEKTKNKEKLISFDKDKKSPLFPNEVTAGFKDFIKNNRGNLYYQNWANEYIVYDKALVRVRYIVQLTTKN